MPQKTKPSRNLGAYSGLGGPGDLADRIRRANAPDSAKAARDSAKAAPKPRPKPNPPNLGKLVKDAATGAGKVARGAARAASDTLAKATGSPEKTREWERREAKIKESRAVGRGMKVLKRLGK